MPEPVAATPPAPLAAGASPESVLPNPAPITPAIVNDPRLPEGTRKADTLAQDIDKFFDEPETPKGAPVVAPKTPPAVVEPAKPAVGSVAAKLAEKAAALKTPVAPVAPKTDAPATSPDSAVEKAEAEMRAHNPKWKPAEGWNVLKTTLRAESEARAKAEKRNAELEAKSAAPVVVGMTAQEVEDLKAREKAASDQLLVLKLESHPSFKAQFVEPKNAEIARATELLKVHNVSADVAALIQKPRGELGKAVTEVLKDVPEFDRVEIAESIRKAYSIEQSAKAALGQSHELSKALTQQSVERQRKAFETRWAPVSAAIGEFAQPVETPADATPEQRASDEAYNRDLAELRQKSEAIALSPTSDEAIAENSIKAAAYDLHIQRVLPRVISEYEQVVNLNRQLVAELNALRGRNPNHGMRPVTGGGNDTPADPKQMDHTQAADHFFHKA